LIQQQTAKGTAPLNTINQQVPFATRGYCPLWPEPSADFAWPGVPCYYIFNQIFSLLVPLLIFFS
jgi:hypothetical protein